MSVWSTKRKVTYLSVIFGTIFVIIAVPLFFYFYKAPTCFDGKKNGDETGTDCGGSCSLLCSVDTLAPVVDWSRVFKVTPNIYNAVAYVENPNIFSKSDDVSYVFKVYDGTNNLIVERKGHTFIPRGKNFAIFEGGIDVGAKIPVVTRFEFTSPIVWTKDVAETPDIYVRDKALSDPFTLPHVSATVENRGVSVVSNIEFVAIVYDEDDNAIAASRTYLDTINRDSLPVVFTWPLPFAAKLGRCEAPVDVAIALDRSGSMSALGKDPPQPLFDVKKAAEDFVDQLKKGDQASLVSFANMPSDPIDTTLTADFASLKNSIDRISILTDGTQNTNIGDSIKSATAELDSSRHTSAANRILVLLTDGVANRPLKTGDPKYPEAYALGEASSTKSGGVQIYTIGLGKDINKNFLENIASAPDHYFAAPHSSELSGIYGNIAGAICKRGPAVIEIIPRVVPRGFFQ